MLWSLGVTLDGLTLMLGDNMSAALNTSVSSNNVKASNIIDTKSKLKNHNNSLQFSGINYLQTNSDIGLNLLSQNNSRNNSRPNSGSKFKVTKEKLANYSLNNSIADQIKSKPVNNLKGNIFQKNPINVNNFNRVFSPGKEKLNNSKSNISLLKKIHQPPQKKPLNFNKLNFNDISIGNINSLNSNNTNFVNSQIQNENPCFKISNVNNFNNNYFLGSSSLVNNFKVGENLKAKLGSNLNSRANSKNK